MGCSNRELQLAILVDLGVAKPVAILYGAGLAPCAVFTYGFIGASIHAAMGYFEDLTFWGQVADPGAISFSCIPTFVLLFFASRLEWRKRDVDGLVFSFVAAALVLLVAGAITAHAEVINRRIGLAQIVTCLVGAAVAHRKGNPSLRKSNEKRRR